MATLRDELEILRILIAAIEKHARGDVAALARGIIEELRAAGMEIRRTNMTPNRYPGAHL
jgi:hypothetical protein